MTRTDYWGVDQDNLLVSPFPPDQANPPGVPVIDFAEVMPLPLAGTDSSTSSKAPWIVAGLGVAVMVGLGIFLAR